MSPSPSGPLRQLLVRTHLFEPAKAAKISAERLLEGGRDAVHRKSAPNAPSDDRLPDTHQLLVDFWEHASSNWYYDILTVAAIKRILEPGDMAIDVGAHTGDVLQHIIAAAPDVAHLAVEPLPHLAAALRTNFPTVTVAEAALVETPDGPLRFHHVTSNPGYSGIRQRSFDRPTEDVELIEVDTARLDDLVPAEQSPRVIKLDVEGAELGVLRGASRILKEDRPVVIFEHGLGAANHYDTTPRAIHDLFSGHGYELFLLGSWLESGPALSAQQFVDQFEQHRNYYFLAAPADPS